MPPLRFEKVFISDERYEAAGVFDVNNDGHLDIVSGAYWYPGPKFDRKCKIGPVMAAGEYFDDFSTLPLDVNGDGYVDLVTGGWFGQCLVWKENPKGDPTKAWEVHKIADTGNVETTRMWDIDGCGVPEIVPNTPGAPQKVFKLVTDERGRGTGAFKEHVIYAPEKGGTGHGFGCGDINGDGRPDLVLANGWLEQPPKPYEQPWTFHPEFNLGGASCPVLVVDVNGDGLADLIVGQAHGYGLDWFEQRVEGGKRSWIKHPIDPFNSQYHDLVWADIDGDGKPELITGKRYRAHCGHDPGEYDPYGIYYFKWTGESFVKQVVDYGPVRQAQGCGIAFEVVDIDRSGDGLLDIVAPGKDGLFLFRNRGFAQNMGD
ncbi:MAG: VCBS repeat-containing protein [Planctomycetes bacterium]|nr:VCBS repeat-containing protein [Planctomycetota bacterium]